MAIDFEQAVFEAQLQEVLGLSEASRWVLERDESVPLGLFATLYPKSKPEDVFKARFRWSGLYRPPSLKFIEIATGSDRSPMAWPRCPGFRPTSLDACVPWTAEGQALHPEWARSVTHAFPNLEAPVQFAVLTLQICLDTSYQGRGPQ